MAFSRLGATEVRSLFFISPFIVPRSKTPGRAQSAKSATFRFRRCGRKAPRALLISFSPSDFEIRRIVGEQGFATITDWDYYDDFRARDPLAPTRTTETSTPTIRLYEAIIVSPPRLRNARVLLKEFFDPAAELAVNEAEAYKTLYAATSPAAQGDEQAALIDADTVPVATLLGTFLTDNSFSDASFCEFWATRFPRSPTPPAVGTPFLVFRWEGTMTAQNAAVTSPENDIPGTRILDGLFSSGLQRTKSEYARSLARGAVHALKYLHGTGGIVHRSLGLASLMVNTLEYRYARSLQVKLRDLGFAKPVSALALGRDLERARKGGAVTPGEISSYFYAEDIYSLGYALTEFFFSFFSSISRTQDFFKIILEDTFELDIYQFRAYCSEDPDYNHVVAFLDDMEGWQFIQAMLQARVNFKDVSITTIAKMPFLNV